MNKRDTIYYNLSEVKKMRATALYIINNFYPMVKTRKEVMIYIMGQESLKYVTWRTNCVHVYAMCLVELNKALATLKMSRVEKAAFLGLDKQENYLTYEDIHNFVRLIYSIGRKDKTLNGTFKEWTTQLKDESM